MRKMSDIVRDQSPLMLPPDGLAFPNCSAFAA
jgi:hypothetical protein